MQNTLFTVGHSTHTLERFIALLRMHDVTAICDVRSKPYSRVNPQFNRENLRVGLKQCGIAYVFLGKELGARSEDPACYVEGRVQYDRIADSIEFRSGLDRVQEGMKKFRIALMCAEKEPIECHRTILIARNLAGLGVSILHIHANGRLESQAELSERLMRELAMPESDMFRTHEDVLKDAFKIQETRIAYATGGVVSGAASTRSAAG